MTTERREKRRGVDDRCLFSGGAAPTEVGSVTLWLVIMTVAMIAAIGLVYDGGQALATKGEAISDAAGAARAGAEALDQDAFARGQSAQPDQQAAIGAARAFLSAAGVPGQQVTVSVAGPVVTVVVQLTSPASILGAVGVGNFRLTGQAQARAVFGVRGPLP